MLTMTCVFLIHLQDCDGSLMFCFVLLVSASACHRKNKVCPLLPLCYCDKVPDPHNSHIFREMKHQVREPLNNRTSLSSVSCSLISEQGLY